MKIPIKVIDRKVWRQKPGQVCKSPVCKRPSMAHGMCKAHYKRHNRTGRARLGVPIGK